MRYARTFGFIYAALAAVIFVFASPAKAEEVALSNEKVKVIYIVQADDHSAGDEHEAEFDITASASATPEPQNDRVARRQTPRN